MDRDVLDESRRRFLKGLGIAGASFALPGASYAVVSPQMRDAVSELRKKITLLEDGSFTGDAWGWQFTHGAKALKGAGRTAERGAVHVATDSGDYARYMALSPEAGKTYTISGWMRTRKIMPSAEGTGAYFAVSQFEFQGRPTEFTVDGKQAVEVRYGNVTGTTEWTRFSHSFECLATTSWFEVVLGIYRADGEAWFTDVTFVEGDAAAEFEDTVTLWQALGLRHRAGLDPVKRGRARAAILADRFPVVGTATDPARMTALLRGDYDVSVLSAQELADPARFGRNRFDLLVLPCGESFPLAARSSVLAFLADGGDLLTAGGYAFRAPVVQDATGAWQLYDRFVDTESGEDLLAELSDARWKRSRPDRATLAREKVEGVGDLLVASAWIEPHVWEQRSDWSFEIATSEEAAREGAQFHFSAWISVQDATPAPAGCAFIGVEQVEGSGELAYAARVTFEEARGSKAWHKIERTFYLVPTCRRLRVRFGLRHASGMVKVAAPRLEHRKPVVRINTALGWPVDSLVVDPQQIGLFDADYRLRRATKLRANNGTESAGSFAGYAASGVVGMDHTRWIPVLSAQDDAGRNRGAAGAMMLHAAGAYARGAWAFFGVDNEDLFTGDNKAAEQALRQVTRMFRDKCFLHAAETNFACYRDGEPVTMRVMVSNFGRVAATLLVRWTVSSTVAGDEGFFASRTVRLEAGDTVPLSAVWQPGQFVAEHYRMKVELSVGGKTINDETIDSVEGGFNIWRVETLHKGMPLTFRDNYFQVGDRSIFLQGTDDYLHTFLDQDENPRTWLADAQGCRDSCIDVYENLMGLRGPQHRPTEAWWRWIDAMLLNAQRVGGVFFPGMLVFSNTAVSDADLADQRAYVRAFADRYRKANAIMYYLNGDLQLHDPNLPDLQRLYNDFLRERYGSDANLRAAWKVTPPEGAIGTLTIRSGSDSFADVRTFDDFQFRTQIVRRWLNAMHDSIREVDARHPVTAEFYQSPVSGIDLLTAMGKLDLANFGYFNMKDEDFYRFPQTCRFLDQSMRGKGINVGEFGVKTHPAWNDTGYYIEARTEAYEQSYFLSLAHYGFAMGASKIQNWCWKYPADLPFEWGINYPNDMVPRDVRAFYRNSGLYFRHLRPRYESAETVVLLASDSRMGGQGHRVVEGQLNGIRLLLDHRVRFGTLTDEFFKELPASVRTILYPLPYCPDDAIVEGLNQFVERGGQLYISGDLSYDQRRQRTRFDRLLSLCGVAFVEERYAHLDYEHGGVETAPGDSGWPRYWAAPAMKLRMAGATTLLASTEGLPIVTVHKLGKGRVVFSADPVELHGDPRYQSYAHDFYGQLLRVLNVSGVEVSPSSAALHCFDLPSQDERQVTIVVNHGDEAVDGVVRMKDVGLRLGPRLPGAIVRGADGGLQAVESSGEVYEGGRLLLESNLHAMAIAFGRQPLAAAARTLLLPMATGEIALHRTRPMRRPVLLCGEMADGRWHELRRSEPRQSGATITLSITQTESLAMLLLCEYDDCGAAVEELETWVYTPWKLDQ